MPVDREIRLGDVMLGPTWDPVPPTEGAQQPPPIFRPMSIVAKRSPISATAELLHLIQKLIRR